MEKTGPKIRPEKTETLLGQGRGHLYKHPAVHRDAGDPADAQPSHRTLVTPAAGHAWPLCRYLVYELEPVWGQ